MTRPFRPAKYQVNREMLERWRSQGLGTNRIADKFGCDQSTVRNWLILFGLPTHRLIEPSDVPQQSTESTGQVTERRTTHGL